MRLIYCLFKKELGSLFKSPFAYILSAIFLFLMGWSFYNLLDLVNKESMDPVPHLAQGLISNLNSYFVFIIPLISMGVFSLEKKNKTLDLLFLSSLKDWQIIVGKFLAMAFIILFILSLTTIFPFILMLSGYDVGPYILTGYLGTFLNILCIASLGIFCSSLTENVILAGALTYLFYFVFYLFGWTAYSTTNVLVAQILHYLCIAVHLDSFSRGFIKLTDVMYYLTFIGIMFFLTKKSLERRFW